MAIPMTLAQAKQNLISQNRDYYNRKTWENLLSQSTTDAAVAEQNLVDDYTSASAQAYASYLKNRSAIESSNLYGSSKTDLLEENKLNLEEIYNTYKSSLESGKQEIASSYAESLQNINTALETEAQNYLDYENLHYDYLQEMFNNSPQLYSDPRFAQYLTRDRVWNEETGDWEIDTETGDYLYEDPRLKTIDELYKDLYTYNEETAQYEMNQAAIDYYDMVENLSVEGIPGMRSWQSFLEETNPKLAEWAASPDQYNYTKTGTKAGSFKTITGRESTDFTWSYAERMTGVKATQLQEQFDSFKQKYEDVYKPMKGNEDDLSATKKNVTNTANLIKEIDAMLNQYGISQEIENTTGIDFDKMYDELIAASKGTQSTAKVAMSTIGELFTSVAGGASTGFVIGSAVNPAASPAGAIVGTIAGLITGAIMASSNLDKKVSNANELNNQTEQAFNNLLIAISSYVNSKNEQRASSFSKSSKLY